MKPSENTVRGILSAIVSSSRGQSDFIKDIDMRPGRLQRHIDNGEIVKRLRSLREEMKAVIQTIDWGLEVLKDKDLSNYHMTTKNLSDVPRTMAELIADHKNRRSRFTF